MIQLKRGDLAIANKGSHEFTAGEELLFIGLDYDANFVEGYVFISSKGKAVNWLVDGDFSWVN